MRELCYLLVFAKFVLILSSKPYTISVDRLMERIRMNQNDLDYHLYTRPKNLHEEAEHERLVNVLKNVQKRLKRKPKTPPSSI